MRRREFIAGLGSAAAWPLVAVLVVALVNLGYGSAGNVTAFRKGLGETGYIEGQKVTVEYYWLEGQYDRLRSNHCLAEQIGWATFEFRGN